MEIADIVKEARQSFNSGITKPYGFRMGQLQALVNLCEQNTELFENALYKDLHKSKQESVTNEINLVTHEIKTMMLNLKEWMKPIKPEKDIPNILDDVVIYKEPYGVALVISPWNYPLMLALTPMAAAIGAGNCCILKPSEIAPETAKVLHQLVPKYLDNKCYFVCLGGVEETTKILDERFDYIFFTGSIPVGRIVHKAANKYLTPVTLELGGKSPVYIDDSADMYVTARRVLWGKVTNAGQTCIAPDYILCTKQTEIKLISEFKKVLSEFYGSDVKNSNDYCRIISERHFDSLRNLLEGSKIAIGGKFDKSEKFIEPTVVIDVQPEDKIMQDEIFGPILPIFNVKDVHEAINFINSREKPLALYIFSKNKDVVDLILLNTSSGGVTVNDTIMHFGVEGLPFGGVGYSGIGAYHGKYNFETFTHKKGCLIKNLGPFGEKLVTSRYPPYTESKLKFLLFVLNLRVPKVLKIFPLSLLYSLTSLVAYTLEKIYNRNLNNSLLKEKKRKSNNLLEKINFCLRTKGPEWQLRLNYYDTTIITNEKVIEVITIKMLHLIAFKNNEK